MWDGGADVVEAKDSLWCETLWHGIASICTKIAVPNFGEAARHEAESGMVIASSHVNAGKPDVQVLDDGWTAVASDGSMSAHFEHTVR